MDATQNANREAKALLVAGLRGKGAHLSLDDALGEFPTALMNEKPPNVSYTFWHQLEHIRIAQRDLWKYAFDPAHDSPPWPRGYWPDPDARTDAARWKSTIDAIVADREAFVADLNDEACDLFTPVEHMGGRTVMRAALLAIDHTAYHLGEFVMGRQILGAWKSALG